LLRGLKLLLWSGKFNLRAVVLRLSLAVPRVRRHMGNAVFARLGLVRIRRSPVLLLLMVLVLLVALLVMVVLLLLLLLLPLLVLHLLLPLPRKVPV